MDTSYFKNNLPVVAVGLGITSGVSDNSDWFSEMLKYTKQGLKRREIQYNVTQ